jgi:AraC-like DNA-binding protein
MANLLGFFCIVSAYLLFKHRNKKNSKNIFLALYFFFSGIQILTNLQFIYNSNDYFLALFTIQCWPITLLIGPSLYLYIKCLLNPEYKLQKSDLKHLWPLVLSTILLIPYYELSLDEKIKIWSIIRVKPSDLLHTNFGYVNWTLFYLFRSVIKLMYVGLAWRYHKRHKNNLNGLPIFRRLIQIRWTNVFLIFSMVIPITAFLFFIHSYISNQLSFLNSLIGLAALPILILCLLLLINPYIIYGFSQIRYYSNDSILAKIYFINPKWKGDTSPSLKKKNLAFEQMLEDTKVYTMPGLTIHQLAKELNISFNKLDRFFKDDKEESFIEWKNRKRIELAIDKIKSGYLTKYTMEELAKETGYLSRSNFNLNFKKVQKQSLQTYLKTIK